MFSFNYAYYPLINTPLSMHYMFVQSLHIKFIVLDGTYCVYFNIK